MTEPLDLEPIKARLLHASRGPWRRGPYLTSVESPEDGPVATCGRWGHDDATFIANAPSDVQALVAEVERLREVAEFLAGWAGPSLDERGWETEDRDRFDAICVEISGEPYQWNYPTERP